MNAINKNITKDSAALKVAEAQPIPSMYQDHIKIYPKSVRGTFRRLKSTALFILLSIFYILPWVRWDRGADAPDQAVLADITGQRLYFFTIEIWPQEVYYLTGLLIIGAIGLFLATALYGRLWCGYACPQTVWTDLFLWIERLTEGDRAERIRIDKGPWTVRKVTRKTVKHALWLAVSVITGATFIGYFVDAPTALRELATLQSTVTEYTFLGLFAGSTYLLAGFAREQVCIYMCPWPRLQGVMQDEDSLIVTYEAWRGDPRGPVRKSQKWGDREAAGRGDCVDCRQCVQVCPAGIDIRDGAQMECIGCGLCIDACNIMMARVGGKPELITFDTINGQDAAAAGQVGKLRLVRPRTIVYALMLIIVGGLMTASLVLRPKLDISVQRERAPMFVTLSNGDIRNSYTIKISNMTRQSRDYALTLVGLTGATLTVVGDAAENRTEIPLSARPDTVATYHVHVRVPRQFVPEGSTPITFRLTAANGHEAADHRSVLIGPPT